MGCSEEKGSLAGALVVADPGNWLAQELPPPKRRTHLPDPKQTERSVSLWAIIKDVVGKVGFANQFLSNILGLMGCKRVFSVWWDKGKCQPLGHHQGRGG